VGIFDGVHLGHQAIVGAAVQAAGTTGIPAALTFDPHPDAILSPQGAPPLLTTIDEKAKLLSSLGMKVVIVARFDRELADMPPDRFVGEVLIGRLGVCCVVVGEGWRFGAGGKGDAKLLGALLPKAGTRLRVIPPVLVDRRRVSSTYLRTLVSQGRLSAASKHMGRPYQLRGEVVTGDARGRLLGYPTANLSLPPEKLLPADGVYACYAGLRRMRPAVANIGLRPTFGGLSDRLTEIHLLDSPPLHLVGRSLRVDFIQRLRGERRFSSSQALTRQIEADCVRARDVLGALHGRSHVL
jgi:riboflavin kinase/FMN adenylyltransferase